VAAEVVVVVVVVEYEQQEELSVALAEARRLADRSDIPAREPSYAALGILAEHTGNSPAAYQDAALGRGCHKEPHPAAPCEGPWEKAHRDAHVESTPDQALPRLVDMESTGIEMKGWQRERAVVLM